MIIVLILVAVIGLSLQVFLIRRRQKRLRLKELEKNKVRPYPVGDSTMYFTNEQREHFESCGRAERRRIISRWNARVKSGKLIPVREGSEVIGYIEKQK